MTKTSPSKSQIRSSVAAERTFAASLFDRLRAGSLDPVGPGVTRDTYGKGEQFAHELIAAEARAMGLDVRIDHAANLFMTLPGHDRRRPALMMGSHLDSVGNGGNFDGAAGVIAGLAAIRSLKALGITPAMDVTVMATRAEESVWFEVSYIGSRSAFGVLPDGALEARRTDTGRTLADHMAECGADIAATRQRTASLEARNVAAWVEVHIEQAPQLIEAGIAVAVGTGVPGNFRYPEITIHGEWAHVGLPRRFRHDAVLASGDISLGLDRIWQEWDAAGRPMAFTIGRLGTDTREHALTKVAGRVTLSLDVRAYGAADLAELERRFLALITATEAARGVRIDLGKRASADAAPSSPALMADLELAAHAAGVEPTRLASPASHDTATFTLAGVPSCMLFVRNANGSHNPHEAMEIDDFQEAVAILTAWLARAAQG